MLLHLWAREEVQFLTLEPVFLFCDSSFSLQESMIVLAVACLYNFSAEQNKVIWPFQHLCSLLLSRQPHCFQLDIRKKIFGIFRIFEKHPITRATTLIYSTKHHFTEFRSLKRKFVVKKFSKNLLCSICDLWSLQKQHSRKQQNLSYLSHNEKSTSLMLLKIPFYVR